MNFELRSEQLAGPDIPLPDEQDNEVRAGWGGCSQCGCQSFMGNNTEAVCENCFHGYHFHG